MPKCIECGFLAVRDEYTDGVCEATELARNRGRQKSSYGRDTLAHFFCYRDKPVFRNAISAFQFIANKPDRVENELHVMRQEIECDSYYKWVPGKTPKEHEEMTFLEELEVRNRQWREEDARRQQKIEALYETRHQELREDQAKYQRWSVGTAIAVAIITSILGTLVAQFLLSSK